MLEQERLSNKDCEPKPVRIVASVHTEERMYSFKSIRINAILRPIEVTIRKIKARGKDFDKAFKEALDEVVKDDAELLEKLAQ